MLRLMTGYVCVAALAASVVCVASAQADTLLFLDNYSVGQNVNGTAGLTTYDAAGRQTGTTAPQDYTGVFPDAEQSWQLQLGNSTNLGALVTAPMAGNGQGVKAVSASPNHNFTEGVGSTGGYTVSVEMDPNSLTASGDSYMYISVGASTQADHLGTNGSLSAGIRKDGSWFLYDNTAGSLANTGGQLVAHTGFYSVEFQYSVPTFDDVTQVSYSLWIDGAMVWGNSLSCGGVAANYIMVSAVNSPDSTSAAVGWFDDLSVRANVVPEPSSLALVALGITGLLAYALKKRK